MPRTKKQAEASPEPEAGGGPPKSADLAAVERLLDVLIERSSGYTVCLKKPLKLKRTEYQDGKKAFELEEIAYADEQIYVPPNGNLLLSLFDYAAGRLNGDGREAGQAHGGKRELALGDGYGVVVLPKVES